MHIKAFIKKRQFINGLKILSNAVKRLFLRFFKLVFAKRQILFVTNQKIRTISLGPISQFCVFLIIAWVVNLFYQSLQYNKIIGAKSEEIARLKNVNNYFDTEFNNINNRLIKVNDYLISVTGENVLIEEDEQVFKLPQNLGEKNLKDDDFATVDKIKEASKKIANIKKVSQARIVKIESAISKTGLNLYPSNSKTASLQDKIPKFKDKVSQGGPYVPLENFSASQVAIKNFSYKKLLDTAKFVDEIDRLITLEKLAQRIPLSKPIKTYFISSGYGKRKDPINGGLAVHQGLDFVGPKNEEVISPSKGRVILAEKFYEYGNAVIIDHGFGITTRYGHLSKILVKKGQVVKKGDIIALQGSTGRSTGDHLHYEIRYNNVALNPKKFLEAGDSFFNENNENNANS